MSEGRVWRLIVGRVLGNDEALLGAFVKPTVTGKVNEQFIARCEFYRVLVFILNQLRPHLGVGGIAYDLGVKAVNRFQILGYRLHVFDWVRQPGVVVEFFSAKQKRVTLGSQ